MVIDFNCLSNSQSSWDKQITKEIINGCNYAKKIKGSKIEESMSYVIMVVQSCKLTKRTVQLKPELMIHEVCVFKMLHCDHLVLQYKSTFLDMVRKRETFYGVHH